MKATTVAFFVYNPSTGMIVLAMPNAREACLQEVGKPV